VSLAFVTAAMSVVALADLLTWLKVRTDGMWIIFLFGLLWFGLFFLSYPLQRRYARSRDLRRPGISLSQGRLAVPVALDAVLHFKLDEPYELAFGWWEHVMTAVQYQGTHTRAVWTHATLSQAGQRLSLIAEDSIREAQSAGWPKTPDAASPSTSRVSLWASDLVALVEAIRLLHPLPPAPAPHPPVTASDAAKSGRRARQQPLVAP
jgi:hypothetical protein